MPPSKTQIDRVVNVNGHAFVDPKEVPQLAARYTESFIRRRIFAIEDNAVTDLHQQYRAALRELRSRAFDLADGQGITRLDNDGPSIAWRRAMMAEVTNRLRQLAEDAAMLTYDTAIKAYLMSFYGRAWTLTQSTKPGTRIHIPRLSRTEASLRFLRTPLREQVEGSRGALDAVGGDFLQQFSDHAAELLIRSRRVLNRTTTQNGTVQDAVNGLAGAMGVNLRDTSVASQNFHKTQAMTRSYITQAGDEAAFQIYEENRETVWKVFFVTSFDNRVCPLCQRVFAASAAVGGFPLGSVLIEPTPIHINCRCSWIPIPHEEVRADDTDPPYWTWEEFVEVNGLTDLLDDELVSGRKLDSSRVESTPT